MTKPSRDEIQLDGRGRRWEKFSDPCYFDELTIRCLDVPDAKSFESFMNFSFSKTSDGLAFWEMLPRIS